jgi:Holliday junction resolvase
MNSRSKGARGEREAAQAWAAATGATSRRGCQFAGGPDSPDVVSSLENIHLEVKRTERGNPYVWLEQAIRDAGDRLPVVLHRRSRQPWLLVVRLSDVQRLAAEIGAQDEVLGGAKVSGAVPGEGVPATGQPDAGSPGVLPLE